MQDNQIRFKFLKKGKFKYLSHLDITRFIIRAIKRSNISMAYSHGFNPKPKISFSNPAPLGLESIAEYADVFLKEHIQAENFKNNLNKQLKPEIKVIDSVNVDQKIPSLMKDIAIILYSIEIKADNKRIIDGLKIRDNLLNEETLKNSIYKIEENQSALLLIKLYGYAKILKNKNNKIFKYNYFYDYFTNIIKNYNISAYDIIKEEMFIIKGGILKPPLEIL